MPKLYVVRLTKQERVELQSVVKKLKGTTTWIVTFSKKIRTVAVVIKINVRNMNFLSNTFS